MALDAEVSSDSTSASAPASESPAAESKPSSGYSVTDPGYETIDPEPVADELEELRAENTKSKPSETSDDASDTDSGDTEEAETTPADDDAADEISDELLDRALELGYTADELKAFPDAKALAKDVARAEKIQKRVQERAGKQPANDESAPTERPEPDWDKLIEEGHDPDIIALKKADWQEIQAAKAEIRQLRQAEYERAMVAQAERFDETLNKLKGFEKLLGVGRKAELGKTEVANRQEVFTTMLALKAGYEAVGKPVPSEAKLIRAAVQAAFYEHSQETARQTLKDDIKKAGSQALSRPRSAGAKPLSGPTRALAKEAEFWKKMNVE